MIEDHKGHKLRSERQILLETATISVVASIVYILLRQIVLPVTLASRSDLVACGISLLGTWAAYQLARRRQLLPKSAKYAENRIESELQMARAIIDISTTLIYFNDTQNRFLLANPPLREFISGKPEKDVIDARQSMKMPGTRTKLTCARMLALGWLAAMAVSSESALWAADTNNKGAAPARNLPPIVIGVSNVQSGPSRELGHELVLGSQSYFNLVNSGNDGGIYGRKISILLKDDKYEPDPAVTNTNELVQNDKVFFLFDYIGTPTLTRTLPLLRYYQGDNIVNVAPLTGADPQRLPPYNQFVFNIRASYREETSALVRYFYSKGYRKLGIFAQADAYGKSGELGINGALARYGLSAVKVVTYRRNQPFANDVSLQVKLLRDAGADAVIVVGVYGPSAAFIRDARIAGWNVPIANLSFVDASAMLNTLQETSKTLGRDLTVNLVNSQVVPSPDDVSNSLVAAYRAHTAAKDATFIGLEGWLNAAVVTEALRRAGPNPTRESFIHAMESLHGWDPGLGTKLEFSPTNHEGLHKVWLTRTVNGRWSPEELP